MFSWQAFHFMRPEWLLLLLPFTWIIFVLVKKEQVQLQWQEIIAPHILKHLSIGQSEHRWLNPTSLSALMLAVVIIILAGPSWTRQTTPLSQDQSSLVIILDASESMDQSDIQPSRLERSKQKIQDLLELRKGSKTALITFAGSAHTVLPLSGDKDILINYLQAINTRIIPVSGKFPEKALSNILALDINPNAPVTILWIGDGFSSQTSEAFENYFKTNQHQLIIFGIGKTQQQLSADEKLQIVPLERNALRDIASKNNGYYVQATTDTQDITAINNTIDRYFVDVDDEYSPWQDQGYYLVFLVMPLFLLWFRRGWTLHWGFLLFIALSTTAPEPVYAGQLDESQTSENQTSETQIPTDNHSLLDWWLTPNQQGHWYYSKGEPLIAAQRFQDPLWKGMAYYQAEEFKLASEYFSRIDSEQGLFYLANSLAHDQEYLKAIATYDRLLKIDPDHQRAQTNRKIVRDLADAINLMSESQRTEENDGGSKALGEDDARRAEGAERKTFVEDKKDKQLSAEDIMQDTALHEMWMRNVQPDPSRFLASKFHMQKNASENKPEETEPEEPSP